MLKKMGLRLSIVAMAVISAIVGIILLLVINATNTLVADMMFAQSKTANNAFAETFAGYQTQALERAEMIASSADVISAVESGDGARLLKALNNLSSGMDLITLCDAEGTVLARTHSDKVGDSVISQNAISIALSTGKGIKTVEPGTVIGLSTRGSAAIKDANGKIIGALTCGHDLSKTSYIDEIKTRNNCEATFFAGDERMNTTLTDANGERVIKTKASDKVIETVINQKQDYFSRLELFGIMYEVYYSPVIIDNQVVGMLFTGVNIEEALKQEQHMVAMIVVGAVMLVLSVLLTTLIIRWITKRIHWYESILDSIPFPISVTDMKMRWTFINKPVEQMLNLKRVDVLGKDCSSWGAAICKTSNCGIACLKKGKQQTFFDQMGMNFKVDVQYLMEKDKHIGHIEIVQDITKMIETQNAQTDLIEKISKISSSFTAGSKQIADGAQILAQGSTEQAATVEQLSSAIAEVTEKTKNNADMADKAADLAEAIKGNAEKGSQQMDRMIQAVKEINDASQSISKVIKTIDDIAFQTNILALNAAVEAARAGQHGKGFAVVADEVRNLSAKSAVAAKDTDSLIVNAMEKAELGAHIADETAASLSEIVAGIGESSQIVKQIAQASEEQSASITEINSGIDQVAQVVQQNSATAEESAAASQEMSGQADMLYDLVKQFDSQDSLNEAEQKASPPNGQPNSGSFALSDH